MKAVKKFTHRRPTLKTPAIRYMHKLRTPIGPLILQVFKSKPDAIGRKLPIEQYTHLPQRQRLLSTNECRFEDAFSIRRIHVLFPKKVGAKRLGRGSRWSTKFAKPLRRWRRAAKPQSTALIVTQAQIADRSRHISGQFRFELEGFLSHRMPERQAERMQRLPLQTASRVPAVQLV